MEITLDQRIAVMKLAVTLASELHEDWFDIYVEMLKVLDGNYCFTSLSKDLVI